MTEIGSEMRDVITAVESQDPAEGLRAVVLLRRMAETLEQQHVMAARRSGWTWEEIGDALGVSRQAVHKKYRRIT
ncbi:MAG TPA: helix-turn-helix transcriptional regulator [Acidimicrobiia bacterium]|nr:helix-turn-helix transcriptional regulator [Acidimicrobiia bacterium]